VDETLSHSGRLRDEWQVQTPGQAVAPAALRLQDAYGLTAREADVALLLSKGVSNSRQGLGCVAERVA
jgi:hypothetical protein